MRIRITAGGIFGANGELAIGEEFDFADEPIGWGGRYEVIQDAPKKGSKPVTNPAKDAIGSAGE